MSLELMWYLVICASVVLYVVLDGFDLGVGCLHLFVQKDGERRVLLNAIGPVWDGNEVWIVVTFGGLLAGFPAVYATLCSAFYPLMMVLIAGLMFRAVSIEFRSKCLSPIWRSTWDYSFSLSSYLIAFCISLMLGNLISGIPIDDRGHFIGSFGDFFSAYTILMGFTGIFLLMMHGIVYLLMKTEGELYYKLKKWFPLVVGGFLIFYLITTILTLLYRPHMFALMKQIPLLSSIPIIALLAILGIPYSMRRNWNGWAFISSCTAILFLFALFGMGTFPYMIVSSIDPEKASLTFLQAASSKKTLQILLTIVAIGLPLVIGYGCWIYRIFRGKVKLDQLSY